MRSTQLITAALFASLALSCSATRAQDQPKDQATGDPVADAARKAREQKKAAPKPKKVFTDDDVAPKPAEAPAPVATQPTAEGTPPAEDAALVKPAPGAPAEDKENSSPEKVWRKRFADQRRKIADAETALDVLQREGQKADLQYYSDPQKAMKEQFSRDEINEKNAKMEAKKKEIATLKQQLSDMEDQLRASGGDSGWAR